MKIGMQVSRYDFPGGPSAIGPSVASLARRADEVGLNSFWVADHLFQNDWAGGLAQPMLESYSVLAFVAALTERIQLGTMVSSLGFRQPGLLAKTVTTLDVLSGGRARLGIGAGWDEREHVGLGLPFPPLKERFERLEETLQIVRQMWSDAAGPFEGVHYRLAETVNQPQPITRPHPPILIGGSGEKKTLRLVAQYADACNLYPTPDLPRKLEVLRGHCQAAGRDYAAIEKTVQVMTSVTVDGANDTQTPGQVLETLESMARLGIDHAIMMIGNLSDPHTLELVGEQIVPVAAGMAAAGR